MKRRIFALEPFFVLLLLLALCPVPISAEESVNSLETVDDEYKSILPLNVQKIAGLILLFILLIMAVIGGLGGGTICVHILLLFFNMDVVHSSAISNTVITVSALIQYFLFYSCQKHPVLNAPITDYSIAVLLLPMSIFGAKCGLLLYRLISAPLLLMILFVVTSVLSVMTVRKGMRLFEGQKQSVAPAEPKVAAPDSSVSTAVQQYGAAELSANEEPEPEVSPMFPWGKIVYSLLMVGAVLVADLIEGTPHTASILGLPMCSATYFAITVAVLAITLAFCWISYRIVSRERVRSANLSLDFKGTTKVFAVAFACGVLLSSTGLGGGMTINPLLLQMGVAPEVTAATTVYVLAVTTMASSVLLATHGKMLLGYFLVFNVMSVVGTVLARVGVGCMCKDRFKAQASIIICVGCILIFTAILIPIVVYIRGTTLADVFSFKDFCSVI